VWEDARALSDKPLLAATMDHGPEMRRLLLLVGSLSPAVHALLQRERVIAALPAAVRVRATARATAVLLGDVREPGPAAVIRSPSRESAPTRLPEEVPEDEDEAEAV
jgi:hypothetical protein